MDGGHGGERRSTAAATATTATADLARRFVAPATHAVSVGKGRLAPPLYQPRDLAFRLRPRQFRYAPIIMFCPPGPLVFLIILYCSWSSGEYSRVGSYSIEIF